LTLEPTLRETTAARHLSSTGVRGWMLALLDVKSIRLHLEISSAESGTPDSEHLLVWGAAVYSFNRRLIH
jgi:hypothetical protein